jgi:hypothetical protein
MCIIFNLEEDTEKKIARKVLETGVCSVKCLYILLVEFLEILDW